MRKTDLLVKSFQDVADFTAPKCGACRVPHLCCTKEQCEATRTFAQEEFGIELEETGDKLPFLGPNGCTAPPYLRPLCAIHVCGQHLRDDQWTAKYWELREAAGDALEDAQIDVSGDESGVD